ncbi:MAG: sulfotransferase [Hyphomonadaceae bacterium]|nr:sulfotransferase [Hyphomonadaceae bacterium]
MSAFVQAALQAATSHMSQGRPAEALQELEAALERAVDHPDLLQMLAAIAWQVGDRYRADDALKKLVEAQGGPTPQTDLMVAQVALDLREFERCRAALNRLLSGGDISARTVSIAARLYTWEGADVEAAILIEKALSRQPEDPELLGLAMAHASLTTAEIVARTGKIADKLAVTDVKKSALYFALAKYHDRMGEIEEAWQMARMANALSAQRSGAIFNPETRKAFTAQLVARGRAALSWTERLAPAPAQTEPAQIFLIGAPRTGGSLLQSILTAGEGRQSSGERGALLPYLNGLCDAQGVAPPAGYLTQLQAADLSGMARAKLTAPLIIDKTTHNFYVAPLIAAIHPGARFVNNRRQARDVALSMFFLDFPPAFPEACDLGAVVAMLEARKRLTSIYAQAGFEMFDVDFDSFAEDPRRNGAELARSLSLDWDEAVLEPANRPAIVPTFSHEQVRKPIRPAPGARWTRYMEFVPSEIAEAFMALDDSLV